MKNYELINALIEARGYESYYEKNVVSQGLNYAHIICAEKHGSTHANTTLNKTALVKPEYDVFVLNNSGQNVPTFLNHIATSLKYVKKGGVLIIPKVDCPNELLSADWNISRNGTNHRGSIWKAWWSFLPKISETCGYYTVLTDVSMGVIDLRTAPAGLELPECTDKTTWVDFWSNRDTVLRPITVDSFLSFAQGQADLVTTTLDNEVAITESKPKRKKKAVTEEETGDPT
jgi:hypothetical protein